MTKLTKKALQAAMQPLRRTAERIALDLCNGGTQHPDDMRMFRAGVEFGGCTITAQIVRKSRVSCGVPAPYHCYQIHYSAVHPVTGKFVSGWEAGSFRDVFMRLVAKQGAAA
jgi:hypothetical protein